MLANTTVQVGSLRFSASDCEAYWLRSSSFLTQLWTGPVRLVVGAIESEASSKHVPEPELGNDSLPTKALNPAL